MDQALNAIWQYKKQIIPSSSSERFVPSIHTFIYEMDTLIVQMITISSFKGRPDDDVFRVKTKWADNDLYIFPPFGKSWELFARWRKGFFIKPESGRLLEYYKIDPENIVPWQKDLLKPDRNLWDYPYQDPDKIELNLDNPN